MKNFCLILSLLFISLFSFGQKSWYLNFTPGINYVPPMPLVINQSGFMPVSFWANYETAPLKSPLYYSVRLGFQKESKGWEAELAHLKIYLKNKPGEIQRFSVSHGYNQFFINRARLAGKFGTKTGVGVVIAHPENTVRDLTLNEKNGIFSRGYYLAGPAVQYGFFKEFYISSRIYLLVETSLSIAYANVPVANGRAHVPVLGLHIQAGPGYLIIK